ncbi:MAG: hypothetical protein GY750_14420 [Lentisphaerae bacterium]|nr:hypothetical protein [Lentisphaerota bacterium]
MLEFNATNHEYRLNGVVIPGVTSVLETAGLSDFSQVKQQTLELAAIRGSYVHQACELFDCKRLDIDSLDEEVAAYFGAWQSFRYDFKPEFTLIEQRVFNPKLHYAGTLDRLGYIGDKNVLLDIKTGVKSFVHGPQLAAYAACLPDEVSERWTVYLNVSGEYHIEHHNDPQDWPVFLSALNVYNYKHKVRV